MQSFPPGLEETLPTLPAMAMVSSSLFLCSLCAGGTNSVKMCKMNSAQAFPLLDMLLRQLVDGHVCGNGHRQSGQHWVLGRMGVQALLMAMNKLIPHSGVAQDG